MKNPQNIETMLAARFPLLYIVSPEEETVEEDLVAIAKSRKSQIFFWDFSRGWLDQDGADKGNPMGALARVQKASPNQAAIFVLKDLATLIAPGANGQISPNQLPLVREIKNLAGDMSRDRRCLVLVSNQLRLPGELREETTVVDFALPTLDEIKTQVEQLVATKLKLTGEDAQQLFKACQGLSRCRIARVLAKCLATTGKIDEKAIAAVIDEKRQTIRETGILEFVPSSMKLTSVGGLENLKLWVRVRSQAFTEAARAYGLPSPKGLLLAGIQGTGKSLCAKTIAAEWRLPLLRLDVGRLFGGIVGESESRVRQVIQLAEAVSPCVLMLDEIDKAFGGVGSSSDGDSGTSKRVFGTLLTWMQEKTAPVFIVATANNVEALPAELIRKGRLDELFFVGLPTEEERREIFRVHLSKVRPDSTFDIDRLAHESVNLSGAEIEQCVIEAMHQGFSRGEEFTQSDLVRAINECVPLARIAQAQIERLKAWAIQSGAKNAGIEAIELQSSTNLSPLEID